METVRAPGVGVESEGVVAAVVVDRYAGGGQGRQDRHQLRVTAGSFLDVAARLGFTAPPLRNTGGGVAAGEPGGPAAGTTRAEIEATVHRLRAHPATRKILYWTGHGEKADDDRYHLACQDSYPDGGTFDPRTAVTAAELISWLADDPADILLILDACFAGAALAQTVNELDVLLRKRGGAGGFAVVATASEDQRAAEGRWVTELTALFDEAGLELYGHRLFDRETPYLFFGPLMRAVDDRARWDASQEPLARELRPLRLNFFHNPYRSETAKPASRPPDDETWIGEELRDETLPVFAGEAADWELRDFAPRETVLDTVVTWLGTRSSGLLTVTGAWGAGKSALLTYLAHLTTPGFVASLPADRRPGSQPGLNSIHAAIHCRGKTLAAVCQELCHRLLPLGLALPGPLGSVSPAASVEAVVKVAKRKGSLTLLFDGLDEAAAGHALDIARQLLNRLAVDPAIKVVVGTRADARRHLPGGPPAESLRDALDSTHTVVLDELPETESDIAGHVEQLLRRAGFGERTVDGGRRLADVARHIARESNGIFLVATLWARRVARRGGLPDGPGDLDADREVGTMGLGRLFAEELELLDPEDPDRVRDVLRPLALAEGHGLPQPGVWLAIANAVRLSSRREYTERDLKHVLDAARGAPVVRGREAGRDVYRLAHPSFGGQLVGRDADPRRLHRAVCRALRPAPDTGWAGADPYVLTHLATHAALAGDDSLADLVEDDAFVVYADPDVLEPLVASQLDVTTRSVLYLRVAGHFRAHPAPLARWAMLRATALATAAQELLPALAHPPELFWQDLWTSARPLPLGRGWPAPEGGAFAVAWEDSSDGLVHAAGVGEIRSWGADGREYRGRALPRPAGRAAPGPLRGLAVAPGGAIPGAPPGTVAGKVIAAHDGHAIHVWQGSARWPAERFYWGGAPEAVCAVRCGATVYVAAVDGDGLWLWRWPADVPPDHETIRHVRLPGNVYDAALLTVDHEVLAVLGGPDGVTLWDVTARASRPGSGVLQLGARRDGRPARAVAAMASTDGTGGWIAAAGGGALRVWQLPDFLDPAQEDDVGPVLSAPTSGQRAVALGHSPHGVLAGVREGRDVRLWSLSGTEHTPLPGDEQQPSLAFDPAGSGRLLVADGIQVRLWDPPAADEAAPDARDGRDAPDVDDAPDGRDAPDIRHAPDVHDAPDVRGHGTEGGRPLLRMASGSDSDGHLLCRAQGREVLATLHGPAGRLPGPRAARLRLRDDRGDRGDRDDEFTALAATRVRDGWLVATVVRRTTSLWHLPPRLEGPSLVRPTAVLDLGGQDDVLVGAVDLHVTGAGTVRLFASGTQCVRVWECRGQDWGNWREAPETWPFTTAATAQQVAVRAVPGGPAWLYAAGGESVRVWNLPDRGPAPYGIDPSERSATAFGVLRDTGQGHPVVAYTAGGQVWIAECLSDSPAHEPLAGPPVAAQGLTFAGPPERPLLLGWRKESGRIHVWDVWDNRRLPDIEHRGYEVDDVASVHSAAGVTLMIQGGVQDRARCDQVLLPADRLADLLGTPPRQLV
ncbi:hypothetical protein [Streptomyces sp. S465]|uniref:hypothetical protein n=1 Tax=Streptomyces sp. S465 TaxID=2979468 RepID=UPI0022A894BA|nr:hypothetical protein [Streptomyces sp. S465]WAP60224.1 hypothetical protein N6H00_37605 [Streptomyces sp. S465]